MNKHQLLEHIKDLPEDADLTFCLFDYKPGKGYYFRLVNPTLRTDEDPADVIALLATNTSIEADSTQGLSRLAKATTT